MVLAAAWSLTSAGHSAPRSTLADGKEGRIEFQSFTPASQTPFLSRSFLKQQPVIVHGDLALPKRSPLQREGQSPAVVLLHGTGGVSDERERAWARQLNAIGIASFVLDSFSGRGINPPIYADQPNFTHSVAHLLDAYLALKLLATHPKIDASRVAIMGFSRGGETSVNAIFEPFRAAALGGAHHKFAAYIAFYPYCNFRHESKALAMGPMLMLLGGADEMTEPFPCQNQATWLKERGVAVQLIVYPNAHHGFDREQQVRLNKAYVGMRGCEAVFDLDTRIIRRLDTGALLNSKQKNDDRVRECRKYGARFGGDPKAREASIAQVRSFLLEVLKN